MVLWIFVFTLICCCFFSFFLIWARFIYGDTDFFYNCEYGFDACVEFDVDVCICFVFDVDFEFEFDSGVDSDCWCSFWFRC